MRHNLSHLQSAGLVAETGSFSAAARALGVSQPTVSTAVASVEELLGAVALEPAVHITTSWR